MKRIFVGLMAMSLIAVSCKNDEAKTESKDTSMATASTEMNSDKKLTPQEEMAAWQAYMTPGDMQKMLEKSNGTWMGEGQMWMSPDSPATKFSGMAMNKMILGGRYQESVHTGKMKMGDMEMPFEGRMILGYDNAKKIYVTSWIDNMGTGISNMEGTWDAATKTITFKGKRVDPSTGKDIDVREVYQIIDDNNHKMEMYCTKNGKEMKDMEMTMKRKM